MLKKNILKKLGFLATTCLFSISSSSAAVERVTTGSPAEFGNSNGLEAFTNGVDYVRLGGNHNLVTLALNPNPFIKGINLDGNTGTFEVFRDTDIGSIVNPGVNGGLHLEIKGGAVGVALTGLSADGSIAANNYSGLKSINFDGFSFLTINSPNVNFSNSFKSTGGDNGIITVSSPGITFSGSFNGNVGNRVREIEIDDGLGAIVFATDINLSQDLRIRQGSSAIFNSGTTVNANHIYLAGAFPPSPEVIFEDNTTINSSVEKTPDAFFGNIEFKGGSKINGVIGSKIVPINQVEFTSVNPNQRSSLNNDIYSNQINAKNSTLGIDSKTVNFVGATNFQSTILDLDINVAKFSNNAVTFTGDPILNTKFYGVAGGHLVAEGINIDMSGANSLIINLIDTSGIPDADGREFRLFEPDQNNPGTITLANNDKVTLNVADRPLVEWSHNNGILYQKLVANPQQVVVNNVIDTENAEIILNSPAANDLLNAVNSGKGNKALSALQPVISLGAEAAAAAIGAATQTLSGDVKTLTAKVSGRIQKVQGAGVSSGEDSRSHGAWFAPVYGIARQGKRAANPGYVSRYYGGMFGFDTMINEDTTIGFAGSYMRNVVKHKNENQGDKTNMDTVSLLLYGSRNLSENLFVQGVTSFGSTYIDNRESRETFPSPSIASAKYKSNNFTAEIMAGYTHRISKNLTVTPLLGFEFTSLGKVEYDENGAGSQNLSVRRKIYNKNEIIGGIKLNNSLEYSDFTFIPEIHGFVRRDISNKKFNINISFKDNKAAAPIPRTAKPTHTMYLLGGGADIKKANFGYGFVYDFRFGKKYKSHQGVLTLRTDF